MAWHSSMIASDGIQLHVTRTGGGKPPLLLLHGFTDFSGNWHTFARRAEADFDVIMPDFRSHGASDRAPGYGIDDLAADAAGTLHALGIPRAVLMGHSMGAATALRTAVRNPGLATCVVLEDPPFFETHAPRAYELTPWEQWMRAFKALPDAEQIAQGRERNPTWTHEEADLWTAAKPGFDIEGFKSRFFLNLPDWREDCRAMGAANMPGLLILGDNARGALVTPAIAQGMQALWPRLQNITIPDASHNIRRDNLATYGDAVLGFLKTLA
jgi:pimeloyl-ACP methyl ester carboxylesterase